MSTAFLNSLVGDSRQEMNILSDNAAIFISPAPASADANSNPTYLRYRCQVNALSLKIKLAAKTLIYQRPSPPLFLPVLVDSMPNRRNTSEQVTKIDKQINTIMIQVSLDILLSDMKSDKISARSRKTRQRSLRTCILGLISRYSRAAR